VGNETHWSLGVLLARQPVHAIDFFGLDAKGSAVRSARGEVSKSSNADWVGFGADVLAVADGVVRDARDGEEDHRPLEPLPEPDSLTARALYGNFVVLEISPHVFVHYAHLQKGSLSVHTGDRVRRGTVIGRVGHSGSAGAPHLHLHVSNIRTFEESEGIPFVFDAFGVWGAARVDQTLDRSADIQWPTASPRRRTRELVLNGDVVQFDHLITSGLGR